MKQEKPKPVMVRLYKRHRKFIKSVARKNKSSEAQVIRNALDLIILAQAKKVADAK